MKNKTTSRLAELRALVGISQGSLSKLSGLHVMKISNIERSVTKMENVTLKTAISLADALEIVDLRELLPENPQLKGDNAKCPFLSERTSCFRQNTHLENSKAP